MSTEPKSKPLTETKNHTASGGLTEIGMVTAYVSVEFVSDLTAAGVGPARIRAIRGWLPVIPPEIQSWRPVMPSKPEGNGQVTGKHQCTICLKAGKTTIFKTRRELVIHLMREHAGKGGYGK